MTATPDPGRTSPLAVPAPAIPGGATPPRWRPARWALLALLCLVVAVVTVGQYTTASLAQLSEAEVGLAANYAGRPWPVQAAFYLHIASAGLALAIGPLQFLAPLRRRWPVAHRILGRVYVGSVALGAASGLVMSAVNRAGLVGLFGFGTLAVLWFASTLLAVRAARRGDFDHHPAWMIRSFALTFAAVTLRFWTVVLILLQSAAGATDPQAMFANAYAAVPFLCWLPNLVVAEWLIRRRGLPAFRLVAGRAAAAS